jgi:hypothetical protein
LKGDQRCVDVHVENASVKSSSEVSYARLESGCDVANAENGLGCDLCCGHGCGRGYDHDHDYDFDLGHDYDFDFVISEVLGGDWMPLQVGTNQNSELHRRSR